jgi:hypothetical protein
MVDPITLDEWDRRKIDRALSNVCALWDQLGDMGGRNMTGDNGWGNTLADMQRERQVVTG